MYGFRLSALLYVAAKLSIADRLAGARATSDELAALADAHPQALRRILRGLVAAGVLIEDDDGRFGLTSRGELLRCDAPDSLRAVALVVGEEYMQAWGGLLHSAITGETSFDRVFGVSNWEHRAQHRELNESFNEHLAREVAEGASTLLAAYDFSAFECVADVGGGNGALLAAILRAHPRARGILLDQPHVVASAPGVLEAARVSARCQIVAGDFFQSVPAGADAYMLKSILHDWDDARSLRVLSSCRNAMGKPPCKLLVIERLMPARADEDPETVFLDIHMLAVTGGRERSPAEMASLLGRAGFEIATIVPSGPRHIIEAVPR